jgi:hypothetical protein
MIFETIGRTHVAAQYAHAFVPADASPRWPSSASVWKMADVKKLIERAGLDPRTFAAHSLRAGFDDGDGRLGERGRRCVRL